MFTICSFYFRKIKAILTICKINSPCNICTVRYQDYSRYAAYTTNLSNKMGDGVCLTDNVIWRKSVTFLMMSCQWRKTKHTSLKEVLITHSDPWLYLWRQSKKVNKNHLRLRARPMVIILPSWESAVVKSGHTKCLIKYLVGHWSF